MPRAGLRRLALLKAIYSAIRLTRMNTSNTTGTQYSVRILILIMIMIMSGKEANQLRFCERPAQMGSRETRRSMMRFQMLPSVVTRRHSRHTSSALHSELASRYESTISATGCRPRATATATVTRGLLLWIYMCVLIQMYSCTFTLL